ncbi:helix-turn-helix domain-containing protein [Georgenia thermotolerans]|uniref:Helix-turn-helix domain-containing protein n=1 Tax=Georgenia thermotolerans TaxID=527326 RepID=A0A7J5URM9_9MICO|nr:helix-turn-helix transcriptional regulator [Georgenia thermotolerans]KAE8764784.1 helix-turn-helix domain-containing protein [Georgenia thermotolerans]
MTVIEFARRAAGLSQRRLAELARTQQSSVSEYESRRKSPTLEVVERLLDAADAELAVKRRVEFVYVEDPALGSFPVPNRLWQVPVPLCFSRVQVFPFGAYADGKEIWDLSDPSERAEFYELVLCRGLDDMLLETVDAALLVEAWPNMDLPDSVRAAWQPLIDEANGGASRDDPPRDPAGINARMAADIGMVWPRRAKGGRRRPVTA